MLKDFRFMHPPAAGQPPELRASFQMDLDPEFPADKHLIEQGVWYEPEITHVLLRVLQPGDHVVDVGANVGFFTLLMRQLVGESGKVTAYEPGAENGKKLMWNGVLNGGYPNVTVYASPVWSEKTELDFYTSSDDSGGNALWDPGLWPDNTKSKEHIAVERRETVTLDATAGIDRATKVLKLDIEGAEQHALEGASQALAHGRPPYVLCEINPFSLKQFDHSAETLRTYVEACGYSTFLLSREGTLPVLVPPATKIWPQQIINVLFSTIEEVAQAWPEIPVWANPSATRFEHE